MGDKEKGMDGRREENKKEWRRTERRAEES